MPTSATSILDALRGPEQQMVDSLDQAISAYIEKCGPRRSYTFSHHNYYSNISTVVLGRVQDIWRKAGWDVTYDNWYFQLALNNVVPPPRPTSLRRI